MAEFRGSGRAIGMLKDSGRVMDSKGAVESDSASRVLSVSRETGELAMEDVDSL